MTARTYSRRSVVKLISLSGPSGSLYMMPRHDGIILGGTNERGEWSLEPNAAETSRIMGAQRNLFSQMRTTEESR